MATKNEIMLKCLRQLSLVYGTSVNRYAEEKLFALIDNALETAYKDRFWDRHIRKLKVTFQNGEPTLENIKYIIREFEDIAAVFSSESSHVEIPKGNISIIDDGDSSSYPLYFQRNENTDKIIKLVPSANEDIWIVFRTIVKPDVYEKVINGEQIVEAIDRPFEFLPDDEIPFDSLAIQYYVCYNYMIIKGDNDNAARNFASLYSNRLKSLKNEELNSVMSFDDSQVQSFVNGWWENGN